MTQLDVTLERMGLSAYASRFREEGFDSWETLMDITEADLDALDVKLGHRRKLQRAIAEARGLDPNVAGLHNKQSLDQLQDGAGDSKTAPSKPTKRKYTRRPPKDPSAPKRPLPAYVVYANELRAITPRNIEFKEFTKLVGKHWQALDPAEKEQREAAAQKLKDEYNKKNAEYKTTPDYAKHLETLKAWKLKHPNGQGAGDNKRLRTGSGLAGSVRDNSMERDDEPDYSGDSQDEDGGSTSSPSWPHEQLPPDPTALASRWRSAGVPQAVPPQRRQGSPFGYDVRDPRRASGSMYDERAPPSGYVMQQPRRDERAYGRFVDYSHDSPRVQGFRSLASMDSVPSISREDTVQTSSAGSDRLSGDAWYQQQSRSLPPRLERHASPRHGTERMLPAPPGLPKTSSLEDARWSRVDREPYPSPKKHFTQPVQSSSPVAYGRPQNVYDSGVRRSPALSERLPNYEGMRNSRELRDPRDPRDFSEGRDTQDLRNLRDARERDVRDQRDLRDLEDRGDSRESRASRAPRDVWDSREPRDRRQPRDTPDQLPPPQRDSPKNGRVSPANMPERLRPLADSRSEQEPSREGTMEAESRTSSKPSLSSLLRAQDDKNDDGGTTSRL